MLLKQYIVILNLVYLINWLAEILFDFCNIFLKISLYFPKNSLN